MELRYLKKLAIGTAAAAAALVGIANAAPLAPMSPAQQLTAPQVQAAQPAVVSQAEVDHLTPQEVRWGHHWHRHHWHRRHWGWHRHWHHHHWHRRHWR